MNVFVYGTLKKGFYNHYLLGGAPLVDSGQYLLPFSMKSVGAFPALDPEDHISRIYGEIYDVEEHVLTKLDYLEGHPDWYERIKFNFNDKEAWVYVRSPSWRTAEKLPLVVGGNW